MSRVKLLTIFKDATSSQAIFQKKESGFSLVELMIVVGIIGVLATMAVPRFQQFQAKAKMAGARNMLGHLYTLEQSFHLDNNRYEPMTQYGRLTNSSNRNNCTKPQGAQNIGFEIVPCTQNGPVPRYSYNVTVNNTSSFTGVAQTGANGNNVVCPGKAAHEFRINENREINSPNNRGPTNCFAGN